MLPLSCMFVTFMETRVVKIDRAKIDAALIKEAAKIIDAGGLVAFPTETVYGIACRVEPESLQRLNEVKGRPPDKALYPAYRAKRRYRGIRSRRRFAGKKTH